MAFQTLSLHHLRAHASQSFSLAPRVQAFVGPNGVGKTTLLEAIHYLCLGKGFAADKDALRHGETYFQVEGVWRDPSPATQPLTLRCAYQLGRGRRIFYDGVALPKLAQHVGRIPVVAVLPDDVELILGPAALRRQWLDSLLSQAHPAYLEALIAYSHSLAQLNALYQQAHDTATRPDPEQLELWEAPLIAHGPTLRARRAEFLQLIGPAVEATYARLAPDAPEAVALTDESHASDPAAWAERLVAERPKATLLGRLRWGIHRDEVGFALNRHPLRGAASQGQLKSFLLALKLTQRAYLHQLTGRPPVLLLDDAFERLDPHRAQHVFTLLSQSEGQLLLTDTDPARVERALAHFASDGVAMLTLPQ